MEQDSYEGYDLSPTAGHTQFLDLTNGEGGERPQTSPAAPAPLAAARPPTNAKATIQGGRLLETNRSIPGKVVKTGQEHTGRWTKEEHEAFLSALKMYGKEWKKVAAKVKTRTVVQTRTHAQKYFQKLQRAMETKDDSPFNMDAAAEEMKQRPPVAITSKRKPRGTSGSSSNPQFMLQQQQRAAAISAAQEIPARQTSVTSAAHLISNLSSANSNIGLPGAYHMSGGDSGFSNPQLTSAALAQHGFSTSETTVATPFSSTVNTSRSAAPMSSKAFSSMKIVAPEHDVAMKRGKFPEPSPAACGKRKLAEIAAARMLAGVLSTKPGVMPGMDDGTATPPPEEEDEEESPTPPNVEMNSIPAPPLVGGSNDNNGGRKGLGLSLQIVNPDSLGVSYEEQQKRKRDGGQASPVTPWEGQLKALVSEDKKKAPGQDGPDSIPMAPPFGSASPLHAVCGPASGYNRSPLHKAVCEMDLSAIEFEVSAVPPEFFQRPDEAGFCPLHSASALCMSNSDNSPIASAIVTLLITAGADTTKTDSDGNTPLHWAARAGDKVTTELLLLKNSPKDAKNDKGETPLHWAARTGRGGMSVATVLLENGARPSVWSKEFKRAIDVAADGFEDEENSVIELKKLISQRKRLTREQKNILKDATEQRKESRAHLMKLSFQSRTLILQHPECLEHIPKSASDWECPDRVTSIMDRLVGKNQKSNTPCIYDHEITVSQEFDRAALKVLSRVHSTDYLSFVNELSKDLERQHKEQEEEETETTDPDKTPMKAPVVPFTPMVQRTMIKVAEPQIKLGQHSDTSFSVGSLRAARRAAGAVQHAVDCVLIGRNRNAFCIVRPPGHHAGINGLLDGGESCGFCIFNSVAAGAMHAISDERLLCERCAIVDIDVHHGNGTEEIVRKCHDPGKLFFFSIHLYDHERKGKRDTKAFQYKFYPGTGDADDVALNIINVPITPLWKEEAKVAPSVSSSSHNTRHRAKRRPKDDGDSSDADTEPTTRGASSGASTPTTPNATGATGGRIAYRRAIQNRLLPSLRAFNPDLILISAGFDACKGDVGNAKHEFGVKERTGIDLEPEDYAWTTRKILEIADICCQGRVVSVLEGGYGRTPASAKDDGEDNSNVPLDKSAFSECAMRHVHAMIDPYDTEARFGSRNDP